MSEATNEANTGEGELMSPANYRRRLFTAVAIIGGMVALALLLYGTAQVLLVLFIGLLIAVGLRTASHWIHEHSPLSEQVALAAVIGIILLVLVLAGMLIGPNLANQMDELLDQIPTSLNQLEQMLDQFGVGRGILMAIPDDAELQQLLRTENANIFSRITGVFSSSVAFIGDFILLLFTALFLAIEPQTYINGIAQLSPPNYRERSKEVMMEVGDTLSDWLLTRFISMIAIGIMTTLGLMIINVPLALSLGIIAALMAFIPLVGPLIALVPAVLVGLLQSPETALWVFLLYLVVQNIDNYVLTPIVVKQTIRMPPAMIIVAQLMMGVLFGRIGLLVAAPFAAAVMKFTQMVYVQDFLNRNPSAENSG